MYDFHYNFIKKNWCWIVIYWQRQSYLWIKSEDVYEEFFKHKHLFAIFQRTLKFYDNQNEMVVGKMKDEYKGIQINNKFVGLKSKMHSVLSDDGK